MTPATHGQATVFASAPERAPSIASPPGIDASTDTAIRVLVGSRVRAGQVAPDDREDLEQHLRMALLQAAHRFAASQGCWSTFAQAVIVGELKEWLRNRLRGCRNPRRNVCIYLGEGVVLTKWAAAIPEPEPSQRQVQASVVGQTLSDLGAADRRVAELLMTDTPTAVQRHLGWSKARLYRAIDRIRIALTAAGAGAPS